MTIDEAAVYLGYKKNYLYKLTAGRRIPFYRPVGRHLMFRRSELDKWINGSRVATQLEQMQRKGGRR